MQLAKNILVYVTVGVIVLALGGLTGWYLLLRSKIQTINATDAGRGLNANVPAFSGSLGSTVVDSQGALSGTSSPQRSPAKRLWEADPAPVAGASFARPAAASSTQLYFVERGNGYVFSADAGAQKTVRVTNTLSPKTYEAQLVPTRQAVILRSLSDKGIITTAYASFASSTNAASAPVALATQNLPTDIRRVAVNPDGSSLFLLGLGAAGPAAIGTQIALPSMKQTQVFASALSNWEPQYSPQGVVLTESPADDVPGYAYVLKKTGALAPLFGPVPGLEVLAHPSENAFLYSSSAGGTLSLYVQVGKSGPVHSPLHTIAEKCVWAPGKSLIAYCAVPFSISTNHFLDDWYQGIAHTVDVWWQIDAAAGTAQQIFTPPQSLDVEHPVIDDSGNYIAFENGSDQSLWVLKIVQ